MTDVRRQRTEDRRREVGGNLLQGDTLLIRSPPTADAPRVTRP